MDICQKCTRVYILMCIPFYCLFQNGNYSKAMEKIISSSPEKHGKAALLSQSHHALSVESVACFLQVSAK